MIRRCILPIALGVALVVVVGVGVSAAAPQPTPLAGDCRAAIGLEAPLTGAVALVGDEQLAFAKLAVQNDNTANGTSISLVQGDTQLLPARARTVAQQFISNPQMVAVVGPAGSLEVNAVGPVFAAAGMAFVSGSATRSTLTDGAKPTFFRVVAADSQQGPEDARYIIHTLRPGAVMLIDDRSTYSTALAASMIPLLRRAGIRVDHESVSQSQTNFASLVHKVTRRIGAVILPWQFASHAQLFGEQLARAHRKVTIFGTDGLQSSSFTMPGSYVSSFGPDIRAIASDATLVSEATAAYPLFGTFGPTAYAATDVIATAIAAVCRAGQHPTAANVLSQIRLTNEPTSVLGQPISFAANGELRGAHWFLFKIDPAHKYRMLNAATL